MRRFRERFDDASSHMNGSFCFSLSFEAQTPTYDNEACLAVSMKSF